MIIEKVNVYAVAVPPQTIIGNSQRNFSEYHYILAEVLTPHAVGWGWSYTQGVGGDVVARIAKNILAPTLIGRDVWHRGPIWDGFVSESYSLGFAGPYRLATAALDLALWDAAARSVGRPLTDLLGGIRRTRVPAYYSSINLNFSDQALAEEVDAVSRLGFRHYKMKVGKPDVRDDVRRIAMARDKGLAVMVDANQRFLADEALQRAVLYRDAGAYFLEEPVAATDWEGYRRLGKMEGLVVAGGESLYQPEWLPILAATGVGVVQPDVFRIGGLTPLMSIIAQAPLWGTRIMIHCGEEIALQVAAAMPQVGMVEHMPAISLAAVGLVDTPIRVDHGELSLPEGPGHGWDFDPVRIGEFRPLG